MGSTDSWDARLLVMTATASKVLVKSLTEMHFRSNLHQNPMSYRSGRRVFWYKIIDVSEKRAVSMLWQSQGFTFASAADIWIRNQTVKDKWKRKVCDLSSGSDFSSRVQLLWESLCNMPCIVPRYSEPSRTLPLWDYNCLLLSYPRNRPWSRIGLWDVEDPTLSRQSAVRLSALRVDRALSPRTLFFCFWYLFLLETEWTSWPSVAGRIS
jgi:hypothetical protein